MTNKHRIPAITIFVISIILYLISAFYLASLNATTAFFLVVAHFIAFFIFFTKIYEVQRENDYYYFKREHPGINGYPEHQFKKFFAETPRLVALFILLTAPIMALAFYVLNR